MPANQLSTSQLVSNISLQEFKFNCPCIHIADRSYEPDFMNKSYQTNSTLDIRRQNFGTTTRGSIATPEAYNEETVTLTIGDAFLNAGNFNSRELTLDITQDAEKYQERYISPRVLNLVSSLETAIMLSGKTTTNYVSGSPTALLSDFSVIDVIYAQMVELAMPTDGNLSLLLSPRDGSALKASNQNAFNPILNEDISFNSKLGRYSVFNVYQTPASIIHQAGSGAGAPVVSVVPVSGATSISFSGLTPSATNVYRDGDTISFGTFQTAGAVESVNRVSRESTGQLMTFAVVGDVNADVAGNATVNIFPAIVSDFTNNRRNVNQNIPLNSPVNLLGAGLRYRISYATTARGLSLVMPPMVKVPAPEVGVAMDKDSGISLRYVRTYDGINDLSLVRVEFLAGYRFHDQYTIKVISAVS